VTRRIVGGNFGGASPGFRVSKPGYDAVTEPVGSDNIALDTNMDFIGSVVASGLVQCGGSSVTFPTMSYVPIFFIYPWDGTSLTLYNIRTFTNGARVHAWIPALGIITESSLTVRGFDIAYYNTRGFYNPDGTWFAYSVFATEGL
jgi:hypothetical protein